jgi:hypothetical protein
MRFSKRRKMVHRLIAGPILLFLGLAIMLSTSVSGGHQGEIIVPIIFFPLWLIGLVMSGTGLHILCLPLIRKKII